MRALPLLSLSLFLFHFTHAHTLRLADSHALPFPNPPFSRVKMAPTETTAKPSKTAVVHAIQPLTPAKANEPASVPLRRRSLRLASISNSDLPQCGDDGSLATAVRVSNDTSSVSTGNAAVSGTAKGRGRGKGKSGAVTADVELDARGNGTLSLRSGKKVPKRGIEIGEDNTVDIGECYGGSGNESAKRSRKMITQEVEVEEEVEAEEKVANGVVVEMKLETQNGDEGSKSVDSNNRGKRKLGGSSSKSSESVVVIENVDDGSTSAGRTRLSREEKGKAVVVDVDFPHNAVFPEVKLESSDAKHSEDIDNVAPLQDREQSRNTNNPREHGSSRMERFRDIARVNATRFALFEPEGDENQDDQPLPEPEVEPEIEDWPGPFSTAMKIIRDRGMKTDETEVASSERRLVESIKWVPKTNRQDIGGRFSVPSLQELCFEILAKNVDAIVSLDSIPDAVRHRLSQLLCDSRKIDSHFFELLVGGSPTEVRLRDCSWLSEEQFTKSFQMCDAANLMVLQLDQCGRCLPDYVILATLAQLPGRLPRLTTVSIRGACRLSDAGLRGLVSSAPALRSINLSQCSLLTSASVFILAESLKSLLKELYLDECTGIDAALIVPALMELEHLEVLSVAGIPTVCDEFVKDYIIACGHNIKELVLKDCIKLTDTSMKVIAEHCPGLYVLDIMNSCKLTDLSIGYLTNGCRALHTLKLCRNPFSDEAIAAFVETTGESLKELSLNNIKKVGYHTTLSLASHAKNLHTLDLSWCRNLTDNALGLIVDSCLSLRLLKLFGCTQVTDVFLNGHANLQIQIIGIKMSPVLQHVRVPDPHQGALNYSSVSVDLV